MSHSRFSQLFLFSGFVFLIVAASFPTFAQQVAASNVIVPPLVNFSGVLSDLNGKPLSGVVGVTFSLYQEQQGGAPLWLESQNVSVDETGHYSVMLGSTTSTGLPADIFVAGQAHWLGVQVSGQAEQPRVMLLSVPYALKAADAQTVGGLPPSAFVLAAPPNSGATTAVPVAAAATANPSVTPATTSDVTTSGGTVDTIPLFSTATNIQNSLLTQTGTTAVNVGGKLNLPSTATATKTAGADSQPLDFVASSFSSTTSTAMNQTFQWQAQPADNDTASPSATLNLLFGSGTSTPAQTGLHVASNGLITFASGQTFPGTGDGSVTSVATGLGLKGGTITKSGTLTIDTKVVPQLAAANRFTANQTVDAILTVANSSLAVHGTSAGASATGLGRSNAGVWGDTGGAAGTGYAGVLGTADGNSAGWFLNNGASATVFAANAGSGYGVVAQGANGVQGVSTAGSGVAGGVFTGFSAPSGSGQLGTAGVHATGGTPDPLLEGPIGADGVDAYGASGEVSVAGAGVIGYGGNGLDDDGDGGQFFGGDTSSSGDGVFGEAGSGFAADFAGDVNISGNLSKSGGSFKIDHPLDPANKYLYHSFVESSDMMNVYNGNVVLDANGEAVVDFPEWFGVLNRDFRYQLTCIGGFAPVYVAEEVSSNRFKIAGGRPGLKVSWQVTGIRQDPWANAHRIPTEEEKEPRLRGFYIHPELYGVPPEKQIEWARHPQMMKKMEQARQAQLQHRQAAGAGAASVSATVAAAK